MGSYKPRSRPRHGHTGPSGGAIGRNQGHRCPNNQRRRHDTIKGQQAVLPPPTSHLLTRFHLCRTRFINGDLSLARRGHRGVGLDCAGPSQHLTVATRAASIRSGPPRNNPGQREPVWIAFIQHLFGCVQPRPGAVRRHQQTYRVPGPGTHKPPEARFNPHTCLVKPSPRSRCFLQRMSQPPGAQRAPN